MNSIFTNFNPVILDSAPVAAHYGNPFQEQARLAQGRGFTDLSHFMVVTVTGPDRKKWLHSLTTCPLEFMQPNESRQMLILDPHGHIEHQALAMDDGETLFLLLEPGTAQALVDFLNKMKFMMRAEIVLHQDAQIIGVVLPREEKIPEELLATADAVLLDLWPKVLAGGADYGVSDLEHPAISRQRNYLLYLTERKGFEGKTNLEHGVDTLVAAGYKVAGLSAWEAQRIVDWQPSFCGEVIFGERVLPHELDLLRTGVHLEKGCYRGQETVAKIVNLGKPPRRLAFLYLEGPEGDLPAPGTRVEFRGRPAGVITSVARDFESGPVALALLKRNVPADAVLELGDFVASSVEIVGTAGKSSVSPETRPGAELRKTSRS
ncbi:MAG: folate-binding protein [Arcanobacterium sp.]|nr:folate-binding protein [Arcanobacterium sp.]